VITEKLEKLGLNKKEAQIYLAALESGETNIEGLSKKSKIKRTTVYDIVESLKEKGLLSSTFSKKKKYIFANDPRKINEKLDEQKAIFRKLMPELLSISNLIEKKPRIKIFEREEGLKEIYLNILRYPDRPIYTWASEEMFNFLDSDFLSDNFKKRMGSKIWTHVIAPNNEDMRKYKADGQKQLRITKLIDEQKYPIGVEVDLYAGYKVGILLFNEKIALLIESKKLHDGLKSIFDFNWDNC